MIPSPACGNADIDAEDECEASLDVPLCEDELDCDVAPCVDASRKPKPKHAKPKRAPNAARARLVKPPREPNASGSWFALLLLVTLLVGLALAVFTFARPLLGF